MPLCALICLLGKASAYSAKFFLLFWNNEILYYHESSTLRNSNVVQYRHWRGSYSLEWGDCYETISTQYFAVPLILISSLDTQHYAIFATVCFVHILINANAENSNVHWPSSSLSFCMLTRIIILFLSGKYSYTLHILCSETFVCYEELSISYSPHFFPYVFIIVVSRRKLWFMNELRVLLVLLMFFFLLDFIQRTYYVYYESK